MSTKYDRTNKDSIITYAKQLVGRSLVEACIDSFDKSKFSGKGSFGQLLEKFYFGYEVNSDSRADFHEVGLELKSSPLKRLKKKGRINSKERIVLGIIGFNEIILQDFETSDFLKKNSKLLLVFYMYERTELPFEHIIKFVDEWIFSNTDIEVIKRDWIKIKGKIQRGLAHELSEGDTFYLGACTKGANKYSLRNQPNSEKQAKQRAFSLKQGYVNHIVATIANKVGEPSPERYGRLISSFEEIKSKSIEEIVFDKFAPFIGKNNEELSELFQISKLKFTSKNASAIFMRKVLNSSMGKDIEEFIKADVKMKVVTINQNNMPVQDVSFPCFEYFDFVKTSWQDSDAKIDFERKYLFVFLKKSDDGFVLDSIKFWNMSDFDLQKARAVWVGAKKLIRKGRIVRGFNVDKNGKKTRETYFPTVKNEISQIRPHGLTKYTNPLPVPDIETNVREYTNHSFWLNKAYVKRAIYEA